MLGRRIAAGEPRSHAPSEMLSECGVELTELRDRCANPPGEGDPHAIDIRRCAACATAEPGGGPQLVAELLDLGLRGGGASRVVATLGVLELTAQLGQAVPVLRKRAVVEHGAGVAQT